MGVPIQGTKLNKTIRVLAAAVLAAGSVSTSSAGFAEIGWTSEQLEVIESIRSCWESSDKSWWLENCYREDLVGWYKDNPAPITIADKRVVDAREFSGYTNELVESD
jgi:hypothetical protein